MGIRRDFDAWENSTFKYPAIIDAEYHPMHKLLTTSESKTIQFEKLLKNEKLHYKLKEVLTMLKKLSFTNANKYLFIRKILEHEIQFGNPHSVIDKLYHEGLFEIRSNASFGCHHNPHWDHSKSLTSYFDCV